MRRLCHNQGCYISLGETSEHKRNTRWAIAHPSGIGIGSAGRRQTEQVGF